MTDAAKRVQKILMEDAEVMGLLAGGGGVARIKSLKATAYPRIEVGLYGDADTEFCDNKPMGYEATVDVFIIVAAQDQKRTVYDIGLAVNECLSKRGYTRVGNRDGYDDSPDIVYIKSMRFSATYGTNGVEIGGSA